MPPRTTMLQGRRKRYAIATSVAIVAISVALYLASERHPYKNFNIWNFDSYEEDKAPDGFLSTLTGGGEKGSWIVRADDSATSKPNVLAQLPNNETKSRYQILITQDGIYSNFKASVIFKIISGEKEQAAGLIFRFEDDSHYYVLAADAVNDRFSLCRAEPSKLVCIQDVKADVKTGQWHTITTQVSSQGIAGYLDDRLLIQKYDRHYITGQIGLWTKGDSEAYFDDLKIEY